MVILNSYVCYLWNGGQGDARPALEGNHTTKQDFWNGCHQQKGDQMANDDEDETTVPSGNHDHEDDPVSSSSSPKMTSTREKVVQFIEPQKNGAPTSRKIPAEDLEVSSSVVQPSRATPLMTTTTTTTTTTNTNTNTNTNNQKLPTSADERASHLLSQATQHETEAETRLLQALDVERQQQQGSPNKSKTKKANPPPVFPDNLPSTALPVVQDYEDDPERSESSSSSLWNSPTATTTPQSQPKQRSTIASLARTTHYLQALHQETRQPPSDHPPTTTTNPSNPNPNTTTTSAPSTPPPQRHKLNRHDVDQLVEASSADRMVHVGTLLHAAATLGTRVRRRPPTPPTPEEEEEEATHAPTPHHGGGGSPSVIIPEPPTHITEEGDNDPEREGVGGNRNASSSIPSFQRQGTSMDLDEPLVPNDNDPSHSSSNAAPHRSGAAGRVWHALPQAVTNRLSRTMEVTEQERSSFADFFRPKQAVVQKELAVTTMVVMGPCLVIALLLFYAADNPPVRIVVLESFVMRAPWFHRLLYCIGLES